MVPKKIKSKQNQVARLQVQKDTRKAYLLTQGAAEDRLKKDPVLRHLQAEIRKANRVIAAHDARIKAAQEAAAKPVEKPVKSKEGKGGKEGKAPKAEAKAKGEKPPKPPKKPKEEKPADVPAEAPGEKAE